MSKSIKYKELYPDWETYSKAEKAVLYARHHYSNNREKIIERNCERQKRIEKKEPEKEPGHRGRPRTILI